MCSGDLCHSKSERFHVYSRDVVAICLIKEASGNHSPFRERPVRGRGGGGGGADGRREGEEDVLREEERVGIAEDGVLSSTREAALRRAQVAEEERGGSGQAREGALFEHAGGVTEQRAAQS